MCYHASKNYNINELHDYYLSLEKNHAFDIWQREYNWSPRYHENGFDHLASPVVMNEGFGNFSWGLIPSWAKQQDAPLIRVKTLNCISEEMYDKPSYRDSINEGKRCLIPFSAFYEWKWLDAKGKEKIPHFIHVKDQKIFSVAGIYSSWKDPSADHYLYTYSVLTTKANKLMSEIHNSKKRMPVIIPREYEKDWLNPNLTKDDVLALCQPFDDSKLDAYTISKRITSKKEDTNVPAVMEKFDYEKTTLF
jgi:putative SOS response-associated peptidase YedK